MGENKRRKVRKRKIDKRGGGKIKREKKRKGGEKVRENREN